MRTEGAVRHASGVGARKPACADFAEYQRTKDRRERDRLFEAHTHLAYTIARRFAGRGEDMDDLRQVALLALVQAIERFDPSRGLAFSTFATPTIAGSLKRHFRDKAWAIRPPRPVQERYLEMNAVLEGLTNELCRAPTVAEIATHGNWSKQQVSEALAAPPPATLLSTPMVSAITTLGINPARSFACERADTAFLLSEAILL